MGLPSLGSPLIYKRNINMMDGVPDNTKNTECTTPWVFSYIDPQNKHAKERIIKSFLQAARVVLFT